MAHPHNPTLNPGHRLSFTSLSSQHPQPPPLLSPVPPLSSAACALRGLCQPSCKCSAARRQMGGCVGATAGRLFQCVGIKFSCAAYARTVLCAQALFRQPCRNLKCACENLVLTCVRGAGRREHPRECALHGHRPDSRPSSNCYLSPLHHRSTWRKGVTRVCPNLYPSSFHSCDKWLFRY